MKKFLIASSFLVAFAGQAMAADAVVYEPSPAPEVVPAGFVWTGGYVGVQGGYAWGKGHAVFENGDYANPKPDGLLGGIYAGYNYQLPNNLVFGAEADIAYVDAEDFGRSFDAVGVPFADTNPTVQKLRWSGALRGRVGYAMDRFMPYLSGGLAFGQVETKFLDDDVVYQSGKKTYVGWTVGAGAEYAFTDNLVGRAEYRYTDFGKENFGASETAFPFEAKLKTHDVRVGISYKF